MEASYANMNQLNWWYWLLLLLSIQSEPISSREHSVVCRPDSWFGEGQFVCFKACCRLNSAEARAGCTGWASGATGRATASSYTEKKSRGSRGSPVLSCPLSNPMIPHCSHLPSLTSESWLKPLCGKTWGGGEMERGRKRRKRHLKVRERSRGLEWRMLKRLACDCVFSHGLSISPWSVVVGTCYGGCAA